MAKLYGLDTQRRKKRERQIAGCWIESIFHWLFCSLFLALKFHLLDANVEQTSKHWLCPGDTDINQTQFWNSGSIGG